MAEVFQLPIQGTVVEAGDKLYFYESGTTTEIDVYTDLALTTLHTQPIVADANARFALIYIDPDLGQYKVRLFDSDDVEKWTADEIPVSSVSTISTDLDAAEAAIVVLQGQVTTLDASVDTNTTDIADHETRITDLESVTTTFSAQMITGQKSTSQAPSFSVALVDTYIYWVEAHINLKSTSRTVDGEEILTLKVDATTVDTITTFKEGDNQAAHRDWAYSGVSVQGTFTATATGSVTITVTQTGDDVWNIQECYLKVTRTG